MRLDQLAEQIGAQLAGDGAIDVTGAATLESAHAGQISFVSNPKYAKLLATTQASAVVVGLNGQSDRLALLKAKNPYYAFQQAVVVLHGQRKHSHPGIHPAAHVDPTAFIGQGTVIYPGVFVGPRAKIGTDCILYPNVCVYDDTVLGDRVIVHAGAALGSDGYGFATEAGTHHKIPQVGNLIVEDDVEIGANCVFSRGALDSTVIGKGTKIDAQVVIGHGTTIGPHCLLVAQVGIAGSTTVGHHVTMGGQVGVAGHIHIGDGAIMGAQAGVTGDIEPRTVNLGSPAIDLRRYRRCIILFTKFPELVDRIKRLEKVANVEAETEASDESA